MTKDLKKLNFDDLLILNTNVENYSFNNYLINNSKHKVVGFCTKCEEKECNYSPSDKSFTLQNISHGTSTEDLLQATSQEKIDTSDWHKEGVMFIMEGPSLNWGLYEELIYKGYKKAPTNKWYWLHDKMKNYQYPEEFKGGPYGTLFNSIVFTFKLKNAYLTNLIKCGLNNTEGKFRGIRHYNKETIKTCYDNYLTKEIELIKPKVIFCFGTNVYNYLYKQYEKIEFPWTVISLPHPARGQSGFSHELFRHLFFSQILEGLYESKIINLEEAQNKYGEFLKFSERKNG